MTVQDQNKATASLTLSADTQYKEYQYNVSKVAILNCNVKAPRIQKDSERKPIDLVLVLDRSGSMAGSKLDMCKVTIQFLMHELLPHDRLALISYDNHVETEIPLLKMDKSGKEKVLDRLKNIHAGSTTNLSGGLFAGIHEIKEVVRVDDLPPNPIQSVLLLTDGLANVGLQRTDEICKVLENMLPQNVSLFTFGYGHDHDEDMLRAISDLGRGMYYFVQNIDTVGVAFADCLGGLLSVFAQNVKLECIGLNNVSIKSVECGRRKVTELIASKHFEININDMYAEEDRDVILEVNLPILNEPTELQELIEIRLHYVNIIKSTMEKKTHTATISRPLHVAATIEPSVRVTEQIHRIKATKAIEYAKTLADDGNFGAAAGAINETLELINEDRKRVTFEEEGLIDTILSDLEKCKVSVSDKIQYAESRSWMNCVQQTHVAQRSNEIEGLDAFAGRSAAAQASKYRNAKKQSLMSKAYGMITPSSK